MKFPNHPLSFCVYLRYNDESQEDSDVFDAMQNNHNIMIYPY